MNEQWKPIEGTDGRYEVSNTGKVRSMNYNKTGKVKELKQKTDRYGYQTVILHVNKKQVYPTVHRLVAQAFVPNDENKPQVNHISGDKTDNSSENLEWCTASENVQHAFDNGLKEKSKEHAKREILKYNESCKKEITAIDIFNGCVYHFDSIKEAGAAVGVADVGKPLRKTTLTANGYCFEYGKLSNADAETARQRVIEALGDKKLNALRKRVATMRGDVNA